MDRATLKQKVYDYVNQNPQKDDTDIAEALDISLPMTKDILLELEREGKIADVTV